MAVEATLHDHIVNNVIVGQSEQQSVSELSNPQQGNSSTVDWNSLHSMKVMSSPPSSSMGDEPEQETLPLVAEGHKLLDIPSQKSTKRNLPKLIDGFPLQSNNLLSHLPSATTPDVHKLFVGGLPKDVTAEEFYTYFAQYGEVLDSFIVYDRSTGKPRGFGFVTFADPDVCQRLLNTYEKENSTSEDDVGWVDDGGTTDDAHTGGRTSARLQMRGRYIELKVAQPRDTTTTTVRKSRPLYPTYNMYQQPQYQPQYFNPYNDYSSDDGTFDDRDKFSATLSQSHHSHHHHHHHQNHRQHHGMYQQHHGYNTAIPPMTPGGPQQQYNYHQTPIKTPSTPAQTVLDIAHHMLFYAQLLATPSIASSIPQDELHYYHDQILKANDYGYHGDDVDSTITDYAASPSQHHHQQQTQHELSRHHQGPHRSVPQTQTQTQPQQQRRPASPPSSLSVPDVIISPSKRKTNDVYTIGGGTFYPDIPINDNIQPQPPTSPIKPSATTNTTTSSTKQSAPTSPAA